MTKYLLYFVLFIPIFCDSQTNMEDVVYLKNGSIIRGMITEMIPNQSVKIKSDRNVFVYKMDEIEKMTKEETNAIYASKPTEEAIDIEPFKKYLSEKVINETNGQMSLVSAVKTDGKYNKSSGNYNLSFSFVLKTEADLYSTKKINGMTMTYSFSPFGVNFVMNAIVHKFQVRTECPHNNCDFLQKGNRIKYVGNVNLVKTERSVDVGRIEIESYEILDIAKIQEEEMAIKQKEIQKQFEQKKEEFKKSNAFELSSTFKADYYKAEQHPIYNDFSIELSDVKLLNKNIGFDFKAIQLAFQKGFTNHARLKRINSTIDSPRVKLVIEITDIKSQFSTGTKLFNSKEAYAGYEVTGNFRLRVFTQGNEIMTENWELKAGKPVRNTSEQEAFNELVDNISKSTNSIIYSLFTFSSKINAITKENDKEVKRVYLSNADLVPDKYLMYFIVVEKKDFTILPNGKEDVKNIIATLEKKSIEDGQIDCKVMSGGSKLKELFKSGKEYLVLSSRAKPNDVE